jgi:hypothetical protein
MTRDPVRDAFLSRQYDEGMALAQSSDVLRLLPLDGVPPRRYLAEFLCNGMVRATGGDVEVTGCFVIGIWFPPDYLRYAEPWQVLTWLAPRNVFHPNISDRAPLICIGHLVPGTTLVDLLYQCFEIITYKKVTMREDDALNKDACAWARANQHRFPIDPRPLKRRVLQLRVRHGTTLGAQ